MNANIDKDFVGGVMIFIFVMTVLILTFMTSCTKMNSILTRDRQVKCFEQTQDKGCWGLK